MNKNLSGRLREWSQEELLNIGTFNVHELFLCAKKGVHECKHETPFTSWATLYRFTFLCLSFRRLVQIKQIVKV